MGRPPSKVHDPIGYDRYYAGSNIGVGGWIALFILAALILKGCQ